MVLQSDFPPDARVEKEALSLRRNGYSVAILCDSRRPRPRREVYKGINVYRMRHVPGAAGRLHRLINAPVYPNPLWLWAIYRAARLERADVLHVHDLPLALSVLHLGKALNLSVVFDMHENYPAAMEQWHRPGLVGWTVRNPKLARKIEGHAIRRADKIIVVAQEHKALLVRRGTEPKKIYVVENTPYREFARLNRPESVVASKPNSQLTMLYFGKLNPERNLGMALCAMPLIQKWVPTARLIIIGDGPQMPAIRCEVASLGIGSSVCLKGWMDFHSARRYFLESDVCIMPHASNEFLDNGVPNKLFEYMAFGKPVVLSDSKASARVVRETGCGQIFVPGSPESFAEAVLAVRGREKEYGERARQAVLDKYNWERSSEKLLKLYSELG